MEMNENLVTEEVTENVEQTTEETQQTERTYTQSEVNSIVGKAKAITKERVRKEFNRKYGDLENVLKAGLGRERVEDMTDDLTKFYKGKGVDIPDRSGYSAKDIETLARVEADEIINAGFEDVLEEADRLKEIGAERMTAKEKAVFMKLTEHIKDTDKANELAKIGVTKDVYDSKEFKEFASKFNSNTPIADIYDIYNKTQPRKEIKPMGSMKNTISNDKGVKDYYSFEEASKFTRKELDENPALFKAIENSMSKWSR